MCVCVFRCIYAFFKKLPFKIIFRSPKIITDRAKGGKGRGSTGGEGCGERLGMNRIAKVNGIWVKEKNFLRGFLESFALGVPSWLSRLRLRLLILVQVMMSGL